MFIRFAFDTIHVHYIVGDHITLQATMTINEPVWKCMNMDGGKSNIHKTSLTKPSLGNSQFVRKNGCKADVSTAGWHRGSLNTRLVSYSPRDWLDLYYIVVNGDLAHFMRPLYANSLFTLPRWLTKCLLASLDETVHRLSHELTVVWGKLPVGDYNWQHIIHTGMRSGFEPTSYYPTMLFGWSYLWSRLCAGGFHPLEIGSRSSQSSQAHTHVGYYLRSFLHLLSRSLS